MLGQSSLLASIMAAPSGLRPQDVFATSLYTGSGSPQMITNGINLSGEGGMVWLKCRSGSLSHHIVDTLRSSAPGFASLDTSSISAENASRYDQFSSFNSNGFTLGNNAGTFITNVSGYDYSSWTFRKAPKFFDVVTYTGDGVAGRTVSHSLGVAPGMVIIKCTSAVADWQVYHRSIGATKSLFLNLISAEQTTIGGWNNTEPTATEFTVYSLDANNELGKTYVAYLFAHDTDTSGVVQCGSYNGNGSGTGPTITLGWNPQFLLLKCSGVAKNWWIYDSARSASNPRINKMMANLSSEEDTSGKNVDFLSTGFQLKSSLDEVNSNGLKYVYLAIREPV